jgi:hypothetical protein
MFEDLDHDRSEKEAEEALDKRPPFFMRFGSNPNMMRAWRERQAEKAKKKKESEGTET